MYICANNEHARRKSTDFGERAQKSRIAGGFRCSPEFLLISVQLAAFGRFSFPEDTRHFPIREWHCSGPGFRARRILSCVLHEEETLILRGNLRISYCNLQILKGLRLRGGPGRDRTDDLFHAMEARSQLRHRPTDGQLSYCPSLGLVRQTLCS